MISYAELQGQKPTNWINLLKSASKNCVESIAKAQAMYDQPISGPMGDLNAYLNRDSDGRVTSSVLVGMYDELMDYIQSFDYVSAYSCMNEIMDIQAGVLADEEEADREAEEEARELDRELDPRYAW